MVPLRSAWLVKEEEKRHGAPGGYLAREQRIDKLNPSISFSVVHTTDAAAADCLFQAGWIDYKRVSVVEKKELVSSKWRISRPRHGQWQGKSDKGASARERE